MCQRALRLGLALLTAAAVGSGSARRAWARPVVLFDEAHGQRFLAERTGPLDLSRLAGLFTAQGWEVRTSRSTISGAAVADVDAILVSGAFSPLAPDEGGAVMQFLERGGRLCVMLHIGPPVGELLHHLNVAISNGVIRERENVIEGDPLNFRVTRLEPHPLMHEVEAFSIYGGWALLNLAGNATVIARTSPSAWVDLNSNRALDERDAVQSFGVAVAGHTGRGRFAVFGDDAMFQNQFLTGGNLQLAQNLVAWLATEAQHNVSAKWESPRRSRSLANLDH